VFAGVQVEYEWKFHEVIDWAGLFFVDRHFDTDVHKVDDDLSLGLSRVAGHLREDCDGETDDGHESENKLADRPANRHGQILAVTKRFGGSPHG
jgi:hypothetical protein